MLSQLSSFASRALIIAAFALGGLAVWEKLANIIGRRLVFLAGYAPSRLLELAVVTLLFVIALQLREIIHLNRNKPTVM